MSGAGGGSRLTPTEKEIARKLPLLDEEQQKRYDKFLILGIDANGTVTDQYRLGIVNALLKPISEREQDIQISGHLRAEYFRVFENDRRAEHEAHKAQLKARATSRKPAPAPAKEPEPPARANDNRFIRSQHEKEKPPGLREGLEPHGSDYSDLVRTHERVAEMQRKGAGQSAAVGAPQQPEAQRPRTKQEFLERQQRERADQLAQAAQRPAAPEVRQQQGKAAQQQPNPESPHRPEARGKPKTMEEFLERERRDHAERFQPKAKNQPKTLSRSIEQPPAHAREAERKKTVQQKIANSPAMQPKWARRPLTKAELLLQEEVQAARAQKAEQRPNALPRSKELPAHVREAEDKKSAQQEAAKRPTQQPESAGKPKTMEEFLARERRDHAERFGKAAQRSAGREITQQAKGQGRGPSFGGGISG